jgi:hypothetical protein
MITISLTEARATGSLIAQAPDVWIKPVSLVCRSDGACVTLLPHSLVALARLSTG